MSLSDYNSTMSVTTCWCPGSRVINPSRQFTRQVASVYLKETTCILMQCDTLTLYLGFRAKCIGTYTDTGVCIHICIYICTQICAHTMCAYIYVYTCAYACMFTSVHRYICV